MVSETLLFTVVVLPLLLVLSCVGGFILVFMWIVLPRDKFKNVVGWIKEQKRKLGDDNI